MAKLRIDFSQVEDSTNVAPGRHIARVKEVTQGEGQSYPYLRWNLQIVEGRSKGLHISYFTSLSPRALFKLRELLVALGVNVPKSAVSIDPNKLVGRTLGIEVEIENKAGEEYPEVKKVFSTKKMEGVPAVSPAGPAARRQQPDEYIMDDDLDNHVPPANDDDDDMVLDLGEVEV